jgi:PAS domain S-box-containing protein
MWQKMADMLSLGIIVCDSKNEIISINEAAEKIFEHDRFLLDSIKNDLEAVKIKLNQKTYVIRRIKIDGQPDQSAVLLIDISDWRFYWDELSEQKELIQELEDTFNSSYDEIYVIDGSGITKRINKAGETNYGVPVEQLLGKNIIDLEREGFYNPSVCRLVFQEKKRLTITQKTIKGKHLIATGNPIFNEQGEIIRIVVNSRDISELLNLKKQLEDSEQLVESYRRQLMKLSEEKMKGLELIAQSQQMKRVLEMVDNVALVDSAVLIMGEPGVGKGVVAARLHKLSKRADGPYITVSCGAIPEQLLESELFGCEGEFFAGARTEGKKGLLELASGGTLFLDEITELSLKLQVKLLQAMQEKKIMRVGGSKYIDVDIRFVAATNKDIKRLVEDGQFREDLYYRINVIPVIIPPLRYRQEDIPLLIEHYLDKLNSRYEKNKNVSNEAIEILCNYNWPGNIRELENLIERLLVTNECSEIAVSHLPDYIFDGKSRFPNRVYVVDICPLKDAVEELEKQLVTIAYNRFKNTYKVAEALDVNQSTIVRKIQKYNLSASPEQRQAIKGHKIKKNKN